MAMITIIVLILGFKPFTAAADAALAKLCRTTSNHTATRTYQANLELLSATLPWNASDAPTRYAEGSVGAAPDTAYGLALCRGDTANASACGDCVAAAFQDGKKMCASQDAAVLYDICVLLFSSGDFTYRARTDYVRNSLLMVREPSLSDGWDPSSDDILIDMIKRLLQATAEQAAYRTRMLFATGRMDVNSTFPTLYSLTQCTPDLAPADCWDCLDNINNLTSTYFTGTRGGRIAVAWCNLRFSTDKFYLGQPMQQIGSPRAGDPTTITSQKHKRRVIKIFVIATVVPLLGSALCIIFCLLLIKRHKKGKLSLQEDEALVWGLEGRNSEFTFFDFSQVSDATSNFSNENKLGQGGFGPVYKGHLPDGLEVAIKRLASHSGQGLIEFKNEVQLIAKLQHTNLVRLLGCCSQGEEKILIYEYLPNKSLDFFIFDETKSALLNWNKRIMIIEGIAQGLLYLHKHSRLRVIHRDLKASNILLDSEMNPKISDFGLAKIFSSNDIEGNTQRIAGTYGYMAPEYASEGLFSIKSDVFSFGVLIIEIISGTRNTGFHQFGDFFNLLGYAWKLWKEERWLELIDASLVLEIHALEKLRCIHIALLCVQENAVDRPTTSDVVAMLSCDSIMLPEPKHPAYFHMSVTKEEASIVAQSPSVNDVTISTLRGR